MYKPSQARRCSDGCGKRSDRILETISNGSDDAITLRRTRKYSDFVCGVLFHRSRTCLFPGSICLLCLVLLPVFLPGCCPPRNALAHGSPSIIANPTMVHLLGIQPVGFPMLVGTLIFMIPPAVSRCRWCLRFICALSTLRSSNVDCTATVLTLFDSTNVFCFSLAESSLPCQLLGLSWFC